MRSRLYEVEREKLASERSSARKDQVGSGDRSERIRTYNFPQARVTDHRINLTLYKLDKVLSGEALDEVVDALIADDQAQKAVGVRGGHCCDLCARRWPRGAQRFSEAASKARRSMRGFSSPHAPGSTWRR